MQGDFNRPFVLSEGTLKLKTKAIYKLKIFVFIQSCMRRHVGHNVCFYGGPEVSQYAT